MARGRIIVFSVVYTIVTAQHEKTKYKADIPLFYPNITKDELLPANLLATLNEKICPFLSKLFQRAIYHAQSLGKDFPGSRVKQIYIIMPDADHSFVYGATLDMDLPIYPPKPKLAHKTKTGHS